jgi:uncharacterized protein YjbJ (UPF0337 family)
MDTVCRRTKSARLSCRQRAVAEPVPAQGADALARNQSFDRDVVEANFPHNSERSRTMNWDRVEGNWKTFKGQVQQKWGKLTDDDLDVIEGKRTELAGRLQQRYGFAKDEAEKNIDTWLKGIH